MMELATEALETIKQRMELPVVTSSLNSLPSRRSKKSEMLTKTESEMRT